MGATAPKPVAPTVEDCAVLQGACTCRLTAELRRRSAVTPIARRTRRIDASQARNSACGCLPVPTLVRLSPEREMLPDKPNTERMYILISAMSVGAIPTV